MKYDLLMGLSKGERESTLTTETKRSVSIATEQTEIQKNVAKNLVALVKSNDIGTGDLNKEAERITGLNIRTKIQNVYPLVNVFTAVVEGRIVMTEDEYDALESSKMALLSPLLADDATEEQKDLLPDIVEMVKAKKTAKEIREAIGGEKKEPKAVKEMRERAEKAESDADETKKMLQSVFENGTVVPVGFMATDITADEPLVKSQQWKNRLRKDLVRAIESDDETTLELMITLFGKAYLTACDGFGTDPLEFMAELVAENATAAKGTVVEVPAIAA